jgi:hypothetical protein
MGKNKIHNRHNSVAMSNLIQKEKMINIYARNASPISPRLSPTITIEKKMKVESRSRGDTSFDTISKLHNEYSPTLPDISHQVPYPKTNYLKDNISIANQVIRSYRSFSRRHAYNLRTNSNFCIGKNLVKVTSNLKFEVLKNEPLEPSESLTYKNDAISTNGASSPNRRNNSRARSEMSMTATQCLPERIVHVKTIGGKEMLESINETKESGNR